MTADLVGELFNSPPRTILLLAGLLFLLIAVVGTVQGKIDPGRYGREGAGVIGGILLAIGLIWPLLGLDTPKGVAIPPSLPTATVTPPATPAPPTPPSPSPVPPPSIPSLGPAGSFHQRETGVR